MTPSDIQQCSLVAEADTGVVGVVVVASSEQLNLELGAASQKHIRKEADEETIPNEAIMEQGNASDPTENSALESVGRIDMEEEAVSGILTGGWEGSLSQYTIICVMAFRNPTAPRTNHIEGCHGSKCSGAIWGWRWWYGKVLRRGG